MTGEDWIEVAFCPHCGTKIIRPWREHPNGLYGNTITCPSFICGKEFCVTYAILKNRDEPDGVLEVETQKALQPRQATLEEFC